MYILDTVAISETSKENSNPGMIQFLDSVPGESLFVSVITIGELRYGWYRLPQGQRRNSLQAWAADVEVAFQGKILEVDGMTAQLWGELRANVISSGYTIGLQDLIIAATAIRHDLTVVTRNARDFEPTGCKIINPWEQ